MLHRSWPLHRSEDGTVVLTVGKNLFNYIKASFPTITKVEGDGNFYKKKYSDARRRLKKFNQDLTRLSRMYEKEKK